MFKQKRIIFTVILVIIILLFISCESNNKQSKYFATTKWVSAIAEIAGIEDIKTFAPSNMLHPPEYELKPDDILALSKAEVVFFAGYEKKMVEKIKASMDKDGFKMIQVTTENSIENIKKEAGRIAKIFNTEDKYKRNFAEIEKIYKEIKNLIKKNNIEKKKAYVHVFQMPLAKSLDLNIIGTFGPANVGADKIKEASDMGVELVIDNYHNEVGKPFTEINNNIIIISLINFPGLFGTENLKDVLLYNKKQIEEKIK